MKRNQYYRPASRNHMRKEGHSLAILAILFAVLILIGVSAKACDEIYFKAGSGYKFVETDSWTIAGVDHKVDGWSPYSARFEIGVQQGKWSYGVSHHSQWLTGRPFNDEKEYHKTEVFVDYKFQLWGL